MLKYGLVSEVKPGFARVNFEDDEFVSGWLPIIVQRAMNDTVSWPFEVNERVACFMDDYCSEGVILGAIYNDEDFPDENAGNNIWIKKFSDGTVLKYDKDNHKLTADISGSAEVKSTGNISIESQSDIAAKGLNVNVEATATLKGKASASATVEAPIINLTGNVIVSGSLTAASVLTGSLGAAGGAPSLTMSSPIASMTVDGAVTAQDIHLGSLSLLTHKHSGGTISGSTGTPIP